MKSLIEYMEESLLDDIDLDDNTEFNDRLFTYIQDITERSAWDAAMDYLINNSKLLKIDDNNWRTTTPYDKVYYMVVADKNVSGSKSLFIGETGSRSKCLLMCFDEEKNKVMEMPMATNIINFCIDKTFKMYPVYMITSKKLANNFKKMKK